MTHPRIRRCVVFSLCRALGKAARNGQDRSLQTIRKAAIILSGFSPAMTRNIPGCRTVLSPTACGRSPLAEGAKERGTRVFSTICCNGFFLFRLVKNCHIWYTVFLQVHRQTRCKPATQSYRGPSGQPVANKRLLFLLPSAASRPFWGRS